MTPNRRKVRARTREVDEPTCHECEKESYGILRGAFAHKELETL